VNAAVIAIAEEGGFLHAPDTYMQKIAVGPKARGVIDITATPTENLRRVAKALKAYVEDLCVVILDRPRHQELIKECREAGARIKLIGDGDVAGAIATSMEGTGVDILMGTGGAPEGVLAAAALIPAIRLVGDTAKMIGYPAGVWDRWRSSELRQSVRAYWSDSYGQSREL